jgi:NAD(P)H dehydrogenase (quinone)
MLVYANPNPKSFNHAILGELTRGLKDGGHTYEVVDLYAIDFDPRLKLEELAQFSGGKVSKDALVKQQKVSSADALAFIHPMEIPLTFTPDVELGGISCNSRGMAGPVFFMPM